MTGNTLATFPYVVVRMACDICPRRGQYRLARLAEHYGSKCRMVDLLPMLVGECKLLDSWKITGRGCGAYFVDLRPPSPPPDIPLSIPKLKLVKR
jgi:hypothetical protein